MPSLCDRENLLFCGYEDSDETDVTCKQMMTWMLFPYEKNKATGSQELG